jgi:hypothetical protein
LCTVNLSVYGHTVTRKLSVFFVVFVFPFNVSKAGIVYSKPVF